MVYSVNIPLAMAFFLAPYVPVAEVVNDYTDFIPSLI